MRKADLFDEIIFCLREMSEREPTTVIDPDLLNAFMSASPVPKEQIPLYEPEPVKPAPAPAAKPLRTAPRPAPASAESVTAGSLEELQRSLQNCEKCGLCNGRTNLVFGAGNPDADLMFIGEGPGESEDLQGLPFVGRAGELLTRMIAAMGFDRNQDVYIANIVKCRPPGNRNPEEAEAMACLPYLERQIELIRPKVIVLLGAVPLLYLLNMRGITKLHGQWFEYKGIKTLPTFHPAFLLRNANMKADAWKDLQVVMREFGHTPVRGGGVRKDG